MLDTSYLHGIDPDLALRVFAAARVIAPNIDALTGDAEITAVAILRGVAKDASMGSRVLRGQRIGSASVDYAQVDSWFSADDRSSLRALVGGVAATPGPVGHFPRAGVVNRLWPEQYDD